MVYDYVLFKKWMMFLNAESKEEFDILSKEISEIEKAVLRLEKLSQNQEQMMLYEARENRGYAIKIKIIRF
jgi:hypothetical protein